MTKSFHASGASTGRNAKAQRLCLSCLIPADLARGALSDHPPTKDTCHCGGKIERFDSRAEAKKFRELKMLQNNGQIFGLRCHPKFDLVVRANDNTLAFSVGSYTADFEYFTRDETLNQAIRHVLDVKPMRRCKRGKSDGKMLPVLSRDAALRIKLFEALYGHKVRFVE